MSFYSEMDILNERLRIGERLKAWRLFQNRTRSDVADAAGIAVSSLQRLEDGENTSMDTFLRVCGELGMDLRLSDWLPDASVRPVDRVQLKGMQRQRASGQRVQGAPGSASRWSWADS